MKNTLIINLFAGPGVGKSTTMAGVFTKLKLAGVDCEQVLEYAKELVWDDRTDLLADQKHIFEEQLKRVKRVYGKVDVIVTDGPIALTVVYDKIYNRGNAELVQKVLEEHNAMNSINYLLGRVKPYNPNGRYQDEAGAREVDIITKATLEEHRIPHLSLDGTEATIERIAALTQLCLNQANDKVR